MKISGSRGGFGAFWGLYRDDPALSLWQFEVFGPFPSSNVREMSPMPHVVRPAYQGRAMQMSSQP